MPSATHRINTLKQSLEKELSKAEDDRDTDRFRDLLSQLDRETGVTLQVLTETLIGATVNKLKSHETLGPTAKALVKKWKQVAKAASAPKEAANASEAEWTGLSPQRQNICRKLYQLLQAVESDLVKDGINKEAIDQLIAPRAAEVEAAMYATSSYTEKARSIGFNLKKNRPLCQKVILGQVTPTELVQMTSEQLASTEQSEARAAQAKKLIDSKRLDWDTANEDKINEMCGIKGDLLSASLFTCGRCKSVKTTSTQKQTRSADEPMTVFVLCLNCGNRWKC